MPKLNNLVGLKLGRLLVLKDSKNRTYSKKVLWECLCDCGNKIESIGANLLNGNTKSCGCLQKEQARDRLITHGKSGTYEYEKSLSLRKFGLTFDEYINLRKTQNDCCAICGESQENLAVGLNIDHNHVTGKVRGLLCNSCNTALGSFKDSEEILNKAINYLNLNDI